MNRSPCIITLPTLLHCNLQQLRGQDGTAAKETEDFGHAPTTRKGPDGCRAASDASPDTRGRICGCCNQQKSAFCTGGFFQCNSTGLFQKRWHENSRNKTSQNSPWMTFHLHFSIPLHKSFITCRWLCFIKCRGGRSFHKHLLLHSLWSLNFSEGVIFYKDYVGWSLKGSLWQVSSCRPGIS